MQSLKAVIIHGTHGFPEKHWFPWLKTELISRGVEAVSPKFPTPEGQSLAAWRETFASQAGPLTSESVLFGHSIAAAFILNLLNREDRPVKAVFLVAGFLGKINLPEYDLLNESFFSEEFAWNRIRKNAGQIFIYAGDDDPFVSSEKGVELARLLKSELTVIHRGGHLNQDSGFKQFPRLLQDFDQFVVNE